MLLSETDTAARTDAVLTYLCRTTRHFSPEQQLYLFTFIAPNVLVHKPGS